MTTIAFRRGVLAADSALSRGTAIVGSTVKIRQLADGTAVAIAGAFSMLERLCGWLETGENETNRPRFSSDDPFKAFIVSPGGVVREIDEDLIACVYDAPYFAIGSGMDFALGAMAAGAGAEEAVRAACQHDCHSREPVMSLVVHPPIIMDLTGEQIPGPEKAQHRRRTRRDPLLLVR